MYNLLKLYKTIILIKTFYHLNVYFLVYAPHPFILDMYHSLKVLVTFVDLYYNIIFLKQLYGIVIEVSK